MMNVLVINGHPRKESLSTALANAFADGARKAGTNVEVIHVCELSFNPNVTHPSPRMQSLEIDISYAQERIKWADHIVFVYPTWWGTMPALLKGFIDRVFMAGFAFEEIEGGTGYLPLLSGRTASIITTMDTPSFVYKWFYHSPGHHALGTATLSFCGFTMGKVTRFGTVRHSDAEKRKQWIECAYAAGLSLRHGALPASRKIKTQAIAWLKAIRLQFYPMTFIAYMAGALGAYRNGYVFDNLVFWIGYAWLFFTEVATVFSNEYFDYRTDQQNRLFSPFNGGSRVLVEKLISPKKLFSALCVILVIAILLFCYLIYAVAAPVGHVVIACLIVMMLALGYTVPPLRLSYRTLGEVTVGITHSFAVIVCGYLFQGGLVTDGFSWLLSLPLFFSVLPSIILAGVPDQLADREAGKKTIAVRYGTRTAVKLAMLFAIVPALIVCVFSLTGAMPAVFKNILYVVIPHSMLLVYLLNRYLKKGSLPGRIDGLIIAALTYLVWYAVVPLINLS